MEDAENGGGNGDGSTITVEVDNPPTPAPEVEPESTDVVVVNSGDSSGAIQAEILRELQELRDRNSELESRLATTETTATNALITAEGTDAILNAEADIAASETQVLQEQLNELQSELEPPDEHPNNTHWAFRTKDEWKGQ